MMRHRFAYESNEFSYADSANIDAFGRLRVSNPTTLFEVQSQYDNNPLRMENGATGDGVAPAWQSTNRMVRLQITNGAAGGYSYCQSYEYLPYQAGKSHLIWVTGVLGTAVAGAVKRFGYGDAANGIFYEQDGTNGVQINRRSSTSGVVVNDTVTQANWNIDKMDGTGPSGITLNTAKGFILVIDLQFLSMGRVRIAFDIDGQIHYVHEYLNANVLAVPYMQTASLPVLAEIHAAAGLAQTVYAYFKCGAVNSEGGFEYGYGRQFSVEGTVTAASGARTHILSLRPRTTFNTITNRTFFLLDSIELLGGNTGVKWEIVIGATFAVAPTWANVNATYSAMEYGTAGTYSGLTGLVIAAGYIGNNAPATSRISQASEIASTYPISLDRAGAQRALGTLSVLVTGIGGTSDCHCSLDWVEHR